MMKIIAVDTETTLLPPTNKIRTKFHVPDLVMVTWSEGKKPGTFALWDDSATVRRLINLFDNTEYTFVFHNAKFDLAVLSKYYAYLRGRLRQLVCEGRILDTRVLYAHRYPLGDRPRTLSAIHEHLFGEALEKGDVRTSFNREDPVSRQQLAYGLKDAFATYRIAERLLSLEMGALARHKLNVREPRIEAAPNHKGPHPDVFYSQAASFLAWYLEPHGMSVNLPTVDALHSEYTARERALFEKLRDAGFARRKYKRKLSEELVLNMKHLRHAFKEEAGRIGLTEIPRSPKTGSLSLQYDFWKEWSFDLRPELRTYLEFSKVRKYLSTFIGPLHGAQSDEVYPSYLIPGAETGRWACFQPNLTQIPKKLRPMYGTDLIGADYKSLECYTLAHAMDALGIRGPLMDALKKSDIHSFVAERIGVSRQEAKVATFGLGGGMGNARFFQYMRYGCGLQVTREQAARVRSSWLSYFTDVSQYLGLFQQNFYAFCPYQGLKSKRRWLLEMDHDVDALGYPSPYELSRMLGGVFTCVLPSGRVIPVRNYSQAANVFFQGIGADAMTLAFVNMCKRGLDTCAIVHDSAYTAHKMAGGRLAYHMKVALDAICPSVAEFAPTPVAEQHPTFF